ncbi:MAG: tRNA adenosine(34) deaminase TadA [Bacillota bacterium]
MLSHEDYMQEALQEAKKAFNENEVPIGAVVVRDGKIIGRGRNQRETLNDPTAHAEILALRDAGSNLGSWRLTGTVLYVTIEPCPMCAGALINSRIDTVVYGADEPKFGSAGSQLNLLQYPGFNHQVKIIGPVLEDECKAIMKDFFQKLRSNK